MGGVLYALMHSLVMFVIIGAMPVIFAFVKVPGGATGLTILKLPLIRQSRLAKSIDKRLAALHLSAGF